MKELDWDQFSHSGVQLYDTGTGGLVFMLLWLRLWIWCCALVLLDSSKQHPGGGGGGVFTSVTMLWFYPK